MPKSDALKIRLLRDDILVTPIAEKKAAGNLIIPESSRMEDPRQGKVVSLSKEAAEKSPIKAGDIVLFESSRESKAFCGKEHAWLDMSRIYGIRLGEAADDIQAIGDCIFLSWDFAPSHYGKTGIIRPVAHEKMHYTGTVLSVGEGVYDVRPGDRIFFEQFSNPGKFQDGDKRYAFIHELDAIALVPDRVEVESPGLVLA